MHNYKLPKAPEGHRWRLVKDFFVGTPRLILEKKRRYLFGWSEVDGCFIALPVWGNVDVAIGWAGTEIMKRYEEKHNPKIPYGVLDPED